MDLAKMIMLVGLPGAGKSVYADGLKEKGYIVHSSDKIREELGDVNDQSKNIDVFNILHKRIKDDLENGKNVCYDATNLSRKRRMAFIRELKNIPCKKECVLIATPFEECLKQNNNRNRKVPEKVINSMLQRFNIPITREGFDKVVVYYPKKEWETYYGKVNDYVSSLLEYNQDNSHHTLTLGQHMIRAGSHLLIRNRLVHCDVYLATILHDIGKPDVKSFVNSKGEVDSDAHYYNHHYTGSYKCLFFDYSEFNKVLYNKEHIALLVEHHMKPYMEWKQSDKAKEKDRRLFGDQFIRDVKLIHEADDKAK